MQDLEDIGEYSQDPNLIHAAGRGYYSLKIKLRHSIADVVAIRTGNVADADDHECACRRAAPSGA